LFFIKQKQMATKSKNKNYMWYKVRELSEKGLNKSQISLQTGIDRATVRKYLILNEQEFHKWLEHPKHLPHKLLPFMKFIQEELTKFPFLSAAQIEDHLKEHFTELPKIHSKTVYNFVQMVRQKYHIEKPAKETFRQCEMLPEVAYGLQAQVDFGEHFMQTNQEKRVKVYFFGIVLSRSRYKFVYFQIQPFTAPIAVYAHQLAFEFFEGMPKEILYDQDKVFLNDENLGDYLLTYDFKAYCQTEAFKPVFCHKADPQSKGKIENVVKYVKYNFLRGRIYTNLDGLNQSCIEWLKRTANTKVHSATQKIPAQQWEIEKKHLLPLKVTAVMPTPLMKQYNVRKDNTVAYRSNFYSLPSGTYQGRDTKIYLEELESQLILYTQEKKVLAMHQLSINKGELVRNTDHGRDKSASITQAGKEVEDMLGNTQKAILFLELLRAEKPRYYHDSLRVIKIGLTGVSKEIIAQTIDTCLENKIYNGHVLTEIANKIIQNKNKQENLKIQVQLPTEKNNTVLQQLSIEPNTSDINTYEKIF